ncbi:MAG: hypothetical protein GXP08_14810 [Gammaproteobacteria bacterium]|nr:hypothetical protein [Gammaproteobacteria bacterium]
MISVKYRKKISVAALLLLALLSVLIGCGRGNAYILVPQHWKNVEFLVEIRPGAPRVGMNEFVVVATGNDRVPGYQYVISIQIEGGKRWAQMIQDGHSGVYRRALAVRDPANDILQVKVKSSKPTSGDEQADYKLFTFPLSRHVGKTSS